MTQNCKTCNGCGKVKHDLMNEPVGTGQVIAITNSTSGSSTYTMIMKVSDDKYEMTTKSNDKNYVTGDIIHPEIVGG